MARRDPYTSNRTEPFTTKEVQAMAGVSPMSLYLWKKGTQSRQPLPTRKADNGRCSHAVKATLGWMKRYEIPVLVHPDDVAKKAEVQEKKRGPIRKQPRKSAANGAAKRRRVAV